VFFIGIIEKYLDGQNKAVTPQDMDNDRGS